MLSLPTNRTIVARDVQGGKVNFRNNCGFAVSVQPFPGGGCSVGSGGNVAAGSSWSDSMSECAGGNTALKVYKAGGSTSQPMQFEYGITNGMLWYDMSFIDCVKDGSDVSGCVGSAWAMRGNANCKAWSCSGPDCCQQGYCDPKASNLGEEPTSGCGKSEGYSTSDLGVSIDLC